MEHSFGTKKRISVIAVFCTVIILAATSCSLFRASESREESLLQIHIIDVGNADAILIKCAGRSLLIDAGENGDGDNVVTYIRRQGVQVLNYVIATHPDADHIGGMDVVVNEFPVEKFIMPIMPKSLTPTTKTYIDLLNALEQNSVKITKAAPGISKTLGDSQFTILGPTGEFDSTNNMSAICRVDFGGNRFLFMGDAESEAENSLLNVRADLKADFVKLGHHGSGSSSQKVFLQAVAPRFAAICCGAGNRYGHPHSKTLQLLKKLDIEYYRSDLSGNITVTSDGSEITVQTEK